MNCPVNFCFGQEKGTMSRLHQFKLFVTHDDVLLAAILLVILIVRASMLLPGNIFNTDEAYYMGVGIEVLRSTAWAEYYSPYTTGSVYIFPVLSGMTGAVSGLLGISPITGVRILNLLMNVLTCGMVFGIARLLARRWSDNPFIRKWTPVFTAIFYGFCSSFGYIGTLATYDALSVAFLAFGIWRLLASLFGSGAGIARATNAGVAGVSVALGMMTRFYPLIYTPVIGMMLVIVVPWFLYTRFKLKQRSVSLISALAFLISFVAVYGSYLAFSFPIVKAALKWNQNNVEGQLPVPAGPLVYNIFDQWGLELIPACVGVLLLTAPLFAFAIRRLFRRQAPALTPSGVWTRTLEIAPFILIPLGGILFQIFGVRNYFALTKNMAVPLLASAPFAGYFFASLLAALPKGIFFQYLRWLMPAWYFRRFIPRSLNYVPEFHIWGGQNNSDPIAFLATQLQDPPFGEKYAFVQSHIYIPIILVLLAASAVFFAFRFLKKRITRSLF